MPANKRVRRQELHPPGAKCPTCGVELPPRMKTFCSIKCQRLCATEPTPEEVAERIAAVRDSWSPAEERKRRVTPEREWSIPTVGRGSVVHTESE
jgi:hypothetical protein